MSGLFRTFSNLSNDASKQPTLIEELWEYFTDKYFTLDISQYENLDISIGGTGVINLSWAIVALCFGIVLAAILGVYEKRGLGEFVRKLIYEECYTPESAKTLYQLGFRKNAAVRGALRSGSLSKVVVCTQKQAYEQEIAKKRAEYEQNATKESPPFKSVAYRINYETDTFYISKEASYAADVRYDKKGSGVGTILIAIGVALLLSLFVIFILPDVLRMLDNFVGIMTPEANYH
ncbi:MAG: hypothetical protein J6S28_03525 [Clostridia bacterium]|nr:hypothetical protein [Clostridia bacterium]MBO7296564.1 hypothetical protein [Clostridia bacterium]